jgi:maltokinase
MEETLDAQGLEARIRAAGVRAFLPEQVAGSLRVDGVASIEDLLPLPGGALAIVRCGASRVALPLAGSVDVRRARAGDELFAGLARALGDGLAAGRFVATPLGSVTTGSRERAIRADQSNDSVVVDEAVIVKLHTVPALGPHPAVELPTHLAEVGFGETPALLGSLTWSSPDGPLLLATVTELLPEATDGWDRHVGLLEEIADGGRPPAAWTQPVAALGALVARLHAALATPSSVFPTPRSLATVEDLASWSAAAERTMEEAIELTGGPEGNRLRIAAPEIRRAFAGFAEVSSTPVSVIHGDLHVGQLLPWREGFAVIDFEGNPLERAGERGGLGSPARDVASAVRSLDHVGRIVQRRRPARSAEVAVWIAEGRAAFSDAYLAELEDRGVRELFDERLLRPFEVAQECHEYAYAARYLPTWRSIPDLAMPALLGA